MSNITPEIINSLKQETQPMGTSPKAGSSSNLEMAHNDGTTDNECDPVV